MGVGHAWRATSAEELDRLVEALRQRGKQAGLAAVGIGDAAPMRGTRRAIEERKAAGLSAGMQFTYRNPARSTDPGRAVPGAAALVVGAWPYASPAPRMPRRQDRDPNGDRGSERVVGRVASYAWRDHYGELRSALTAIACVLEEAGWKARVLVDDNALVDRAAAERAGLGWFGKNANILLPGRGSWFVLGSVLTDAPLPADRPAEEGCGACRSCLRSCPTDALVAPGVLDARRCLAWLLQAPGVFPREYRAALGDRIYGCDECQEACPANRSSTKAQRAGSSGGDGGRPVVVPPARPVDEERDVDVLTVLNASDSQLLSSYGRWYIADRSPRYLRRNALIVLGNVGDGCSPAVEAVLRSYLVHADELLRAHAVWAAARAGRQDLVDEVWNDLAGDPSSLVRGELALIGDVPRAHTASASLRH